MPAFLFVRQPDELDKRQQKELALIRQASPSAEAAYGLAQAFMQMIWEQTGQQLDAWLSAGEASHLPELESFAKGIQQDKAAVLAGLTLPYSTGPVEGHVNRRQHHSKEHVWPCQAPSAPSTCAACGPEGAFSCTHPRWIGMCLALHGEEAQEGRAAAGTKKHMGMSKSSTTKRSKEDDEGVI